MHVYRYTQTEFPPYRFVPGENPHPTENPLGHSYGKTEVVIKSFDPNEWARNERYLTGIDLYNHGFWWESHEAWELLWKTAPCRDSREYLQGLIKISGAFLKWHLKKRRGLEILYEGAMRHLMNVREHFPMYMGLDLNDHVRKMERHFKPVIKEKQWTDPLDNYPYIFLNTIHHKDRYREAEN